MTDTATRDRLQRKADLWSRRPEWTERAVDAQLDADDRAAAEQQAEIDRYSADMGASLEAMMRCGACGVSVGPGGALCPDCGRVASLIALERAAARPVNGVDRRQLVEAWLDRQAVTP